ncbi:MAG: hypothetical protein IPL84_16090 [Chitinophagaceae bacterium]|nr:hypothetical protein [Chitinophagaceae bacterium]
MNFIKRKKGYWLLLFTLLAQDPRGAPDAPVDGGLSLLPAAGTYYGTKKYRKHKENDQTT